MNEIFLFDFDGVLLDTVDEVAVTAYNTATESFISSLEDAPEGYGELFRINRCRIQHAGEIPLLGAWCVEHCAKQPQRRLLQEEAEVVLRLSKEERIAQVERFFFG